jgi:predicted nucleic acid-binding protein
MRVLVDTSVWSLVLRKKTLTDDEVLIRSELIELIKELRVEIIGPIRQELLSGISDEKKFEVLKEKISAFEDVEIITEDFETAAKFSNTCRKNGIQGSHIDFLICAVAFRNSMSIFTTDKDFERYHEYIDFKLHKIRNEIT